MDPWRATHVITTSKGGVVRVTRVMLVDDIGYTRDEWRACANADWVRVDGEWRFNGSVSEFDITTVRPIVEVRR